MEKLAGEGIYGKKFYVSNLVGNDAICMKIAVILYFYFFFDSSVPTFMSLPEENLSKIADVLEEVSVFIFFLPKVRLLKFLFLEEF